MATPTVRLRLGADSRIEVTAEALSAPAFAAFGSVVANPRPEVHPAGFVAATPPMPAYAALANQGSAIRYAAGAARGLYARAPSGRAEPIVSVFACAAPELAGHGHADGTVGGTLAVRFLERHPFTSQTFSPLASPASSPSAAPPGATSYLVIVTPSLPPSPRDAHLPVPCPSDAATDDALPLPGRGLPDLRRLRAFVASRAQAVTYGPGTWHAPMVVLGRAAARLDFVVWQFSSGVPVEDCQLVELQAEPGSGGGVYVRVEALMPEPAPEPRL